MTVTKSLFKLQLDSGFAYEIHVLRDGKVSAGFTYTTSFEGIGDFIHSKKSEILDLLES